MKDFKFEPSFCRILCVDKKSTDAVIKKSYRDLLMIHHPDKHQQNSIVEQEANAKTREIQLAYSVLSNPKVRKLYDELLDKHELEAKRKAEEKKGVKFDLSSLKSNPKSGKKVVIKKEVKLDPEMEMLKSFIEVLRNFANEMNKSEKKK